MSSGALDYAVDIGVFFGKSTEILSAKFFYQCSYDAKCIDFHRDGIQEHERLAAQRSDRWLLQVSDIMEHLADFAHDFHS